MTDLKQGDTIKIVITDGDGNVWSSHTIAGDDKTMLNDIVAAASIADIGADHPDTAAIFGDIGVAARHLLGHWSTPLECDICGCDAYPDERGVVVGVRSTQNGKSDGTLCGDCAEDWLEGTTRDYYVSLGRGISTVLGGSGL